MNVLTKNEKDGLDQVFLSIHMNTDKYKKMKEISTLIFSHTCKQDIKKLIKVAKDGLKETRTSHFLLGFTKKKKNLSK